VVNRRKSHVQTLVVSRYPTPAHVNNFVLLFLPPCSPHLIPFGHRVHRAEPTCLSTPWRPRKVKTFCAHSSPTQTQIKPQPTPAILGQESAHTTLSITHHTRERPSAGPQRHSSGYHRRRWAPWWVVLMAATATTTWTLRSGALPRADDHITAAWPLGGV
jgi:hypothetical protein